jgi:hypothetical protein
LFPILQIGRKPGGSNIAAQRKTAAKVYPPDPFDFVVCIRLCRLASVPSRYVDENVDALTRRQNP